MAIKPSASAEIRALLEALSSGDEIKREAAIARLAVIGPRAVDRLLAAYSSGSDIATRIAILRVFEASAEPRAFAVARDALRSGSDVAVAAAGVLRALLESLAEPVSADALDVLVETVVDRSADRRVRLAALDALRDVPPEIHDRIAAALEGDVDLAPSVRPGAREQAREADAVWRDALEGRIGTDPHALREAVQTQAESAPLGDVQKLIDLAREREAAAGEREGAARWTALRGALHQTLALRGSTVAVYDLRETLEGTAEPLPPAFISALHAVGDASCLEPIAAAHTRSSDERWRQQLAGAFHAIVKRERLSRRHAVLKRIETRWPDAARELSTPSRTTPPRTTRDRTSRKSR